MRIIRYWSLLKPFFREHYPIFVGGILFLIVLAKNLAVHLTHGKIISRAVFMLHLARIVRWKSLHRCADCIVQ